jgi:hypothetical protein
VLKDILLVAASMLIFLDPVSLLQAFGYSIALGGLMYYKLGGDQIKGHVSDAHRSWNDYGVRHPVMRKLIVFGLAILGIFVVLGGLAPQLPPQYAETAKTKIGSFLGEKGA